MAILRAKLQNENLSFESDGTNTTGYGSYDIKHASNKVLEFSSSSVTIPIGVNLIALDSPLIDSHVANKLYVDSVATGLNIKKAVRVASDGVNYDINSLIDGAVFDGVTVETGDRVLLKDQTAETQNGVYIVSATDADPIFRAPDLDTGEEITGGIHVFVMQGTINANKGYVITTPDGPAQVGVDNIIWSIFNSRTNTDFSTGFVVSDDGLVVSVDPNYVSSGVGATTDAIQSEIDTIEAAVGLGADGTFSQHSGSNYIDTGTTVKLVNTLLDTQVKTNADAVATVSSAVNTVEASAGLEADGSFTQHTTSNYINAGTTLKSVDALLDTQVKTNADFNNTLATAVDTVSSSVDTIEASTGLETNGTFLQHTSSNYIDTATTLKASDVLLDAQAKVNANAINTVEAASGLEANGTYAQHTTTNYINAATNLKLADAFLDTTIKMNADMITTATNAINTVEASAGLESNGSFTQHVGSNYIDTATTLKAADVLLDTQAKVNSDAINVVEASTGLDADGTYSQHTASNYIDSATTLKAVDALLDTQAKVNSDAINMVEASTGLDADGSFTQHGGSNYINTATTLKAVGPLLDTQIKANADMVSSAFAAINTVEASTGLDADGSFTQHVGSNYIDAATTLKAVDVLLDTQAKANATAINTVEAASGLEADGTYAQHTTTNYIDAATNLKLADAFLDTTIKMNADMITTATNAINTIEASAGLESNGAFSQHTASNYINTATTLKAVDVLLDAQAKVNSDAINTVEASTGLDADGTYSQHTASNYINSGTTFKAVDALLDTQAKANADAIALSDSVTSGAKGTANMMIFASEDGSVFKTHTNYLIDPVNDNLTVTALSTTSDRRRKKEIENIKSSDDIYKLRPVQYKWKDENMDQRMKYGLVAQEVLEHIPSIVNEYNEKYSVEYFGLISHLIREVQILRGDVDKLM
jgi:hypothetical protein